LEEEPKETAKAFYEMMSSAQKPLHEKTKVSQLDAIRRLMGFKSQYSLSRDAFDGMLTILGTLLPEGHVLPKNTYDSQKLLRALKMPYEQTGRWGHWEPGATGGSQPCGQGGSSAGDGGQGED
jgi:hypothetical protein